MVHGPLVCLFVCLFVCFFVCLFFCCFFGGGGGLLCFVVVVVFVCFFVFFCFFVFCLVLFLFCFLLLFFHYHYYSLENMEFRSPGQQTSVDVQKYEEFHKNITYVTNVTEFFMTADRNSLWICFVCAEVLRPSQPSGVISSAVSLLNYTFTGQA